MAGTVTVACKLPNGLVLRVFDMVDSTEPTQSGIHREFKIAWARDRTAVIKGNALPFGQFPDFPMVGGYALTHNVDAELFEQWMKDNANSDYVKNKLIFAYAREADAADAAKDHATTRSGLEGIDPEAPPMEFRRRRQINGAAAMSPITPET